MEEIKCGILRGEVFFTSYYVFNVEVLEGSILSPVGMTTKGIWINEKLLRIPVSFIKLGKDFNEQLKLYTDLRLCSEDERRIIVNTKSGSIRLQAPDQAVSLQGRKYLVFIDGSGVLQAFPALLALARSGGQLEVYSMHQTDKAASYALRSYVKRMDFLFFTIRGGGQRRIAQIVESRTMGTRIMAFCDWSVYSRIHHIARQAGYSNEEIEGIGFGEKEERVFCAHCYEMQRKPHESETICVQCGTPLMISNHYSPRLDAFMGYVHIS